MSLLSVFEYIELFFLTLFLIIKYKTKSYKQKKQTTIV